MLTSNKCNTLTIYTYLTYWAESIPCCDHHQREVHGHTSDNTRLENLCDCLGGGARQIPTWQQ